MIDVDVALPEQLAPLEAGGDSSFEDARRLLAQALELANGQWSAPPERHDVAVLLREELSARPVRTDVEVVCSSPAELTGLFGADPVDFLCAEVLGREHRLTLLHHELTAADEHVLASLGAAGAEVRLLARALPRLVLVGTDRALLPADSGGCAVVRSPDAVRALWRSHRVLRELAVDFAQVTAAVTALVGPSLLVEVLGKLCAGVKDETAARQMRVSVRTYRRYVASILKSLNVTSRFEAGMRLSELGLTGLARQRAVQAEPAPRGGPEQDATA